MCSNTTLIYICLDCVWVSLYRSHTCSTPGLRVLCAHRDTSIQYMKEAGAFMYNTAHMPTCKMRKQSVKQSPLCPASQNDLRLATVFHIVPFHFLPLFTLPFWLTEHFGTNAPEVLLRKAASNQKVFICWQFFCADYPNKTELALNWLLKVLAGEFCSLLTVFLCRLIKQDWARS